MVLKDYPEIENEWGFAQPDPRVLPVCVGEVESTGKRPLQFSEDHVADLVQRRKARAVEIHAPAGSVVLFDMRPVHTGKGLVTNMYGIYPSRVRREFPGESVKEHIHRVFSTAKTTDSVAKFAEHAALEGGYVPSCEQMSTWRGPGLHV